MMMDRKSPRVCITNTKNQIHQTSLQQNLKNVMIKEIKERMSRTAEKNKEIGSEVKKKFKTAHINLSKVASKDEKTNFISLAQVKSNDLLKVQRAILLCIDYLVKTVPKRLLQTGRDEKDAPSDENCSGGENSREFFGQCSTVSGTLFKKPQTKKLLMNLEIKS